MSDFKEFVEQLQDWHAQQVGQLQKIVDTPKATEVRLGDDADAIVFTGREAAAFKSGVIVALQYLGKLPFAVSEDDSSE